MHTCATQAYFYTSDDQLTTVKALIEAGAEVNAKDNLGATALTLAQRSRNDAVIKLLEALTRP
jgi:ankyrin repeat protein